MGEQLTAVDLNKEIVGLFFCLSNASSNEAAVGFITEIDQKLRQYKNLLNAPTYAVLFHQLSKLDHGKQIMAKKLLEFTIAHAGEYFKKHSKEFGSREVTQLICAFPKLPIAWTNYTRFVVRVLKRLYKILEELKKFNDGELIAVLSALAKMGFFVEEPLPLLLKLLDALKGTEEKIQTLEVSAASELWLFCVYAKSRFEKEERIVQLFHWVDAHLKENPQKAGDINKSHTAIAELLKQNLKKEFSDEVQLEYIVGAYALDIAIPGLKLNIEIDGSQHYRADNLVRKDKFRDFVLKYYEDWTTIRIPLREYNHCRRKDKLAYLKEKLSGFEHIFKPILPEVSQGLARHHLLKNSAVQDSNTGAAEGSEESAIKNGFLEKKY